MYTKVYCFGGIETNCQVYWVFLLHSILKSTASAVLRHMYIGKPIAFNAE